MVFYKFCVAMTAAVTLNGCTSIYDGAIYSSYEEINIGIRSAPETATPFKLNFGREQAVVSFVPHKEDEKWGDAASILASNDTRSIQVLDIINNSPAATPLPPISLVRSQSRFVTGNAAIVLTVPKDSTVRIVRPARQDLTVKVKSEPGDRVAAAFKPSTRASNPTQSKIISLDKKIDACTNPQDVYEKAASAIDGCFSDLYKPGTQTSDAEFKFGAKLSIYLGSACPGNRDHKREKAHDALAHSYKSNCLIRP